MQPIDPKLLQLGDASGDSWSLPGNKCLDCGTMFHPPRLHCAKCTSSNLQDIELAKSGRLISYTEVHQTHPDALIEPLYHVGLIQLDNGPIIEAISTKDVESGSLRNGQEVELVLMPLADNEEGQKIVTYAFRGRNGKEV